ncbi:MAG: lipoyl(octanoyl) transferase LipB [Ignavibacteria bacterium]|nr:lipoyl(octanoyl) transferase LipB [Ignavibacteria bacterium]
MRVVEILELGRTDYKICWDFQRRVFGLRAAGLIPDSLLLTEHDHVYTIGKGGDTDHLLANELELKERGATVYHNDRGGDVTYHGPGQLVGYPILDLRSYYLDLHRYLRDIEEVIIRSLKAFDLLGRRIDGYTGVWVDDDKICAIGVKSSRWVTMHGFALNVNTDLSFFQRIIPCGIFEKGVTSLGQLVGRDVEMEEVSDRVIKEFGNVFHVEVRNGESEKMLGFNDLPEGESNSLMAVD